MSKVNARTPKGFRDFLPADMLKRDYVMNTVREVFHLYGFEPLQTPVIELKETLYGKYGEDAENLIYSATHGRGSKEEVALRYDLTVPLARVVAEHESALSFPFKRYQMSPVFRGERPQKGRYREFYQCDVDIVGVDSMSADAEAVSVVVTALKRLGFKDFQVKINHRRLLTAIGIYSGVADEQLPDLYRSVDKFDKVGAEGVQKELTERGIAPDVVARMIELITSQVAGVENLDFLAQTLGDLPDAVASIQDLRELTKYLELAGVPAENYAFDLTMVRGLGYYTGPIFETIITEPNIGSISGGGRYNDLIGMFRKDSLPTTGVSLGLERIIDLMDEFGLYPPEIGGTVVQVLVTVFDESTQAESVKLAGVLRAGGVNTELFMEDKKLGKQLNYADKKGVPIVAVLGSDEIAQGVITFKRLADGESVTATWDEAVEKVKALL
jgi:histidyl-tRNA synthetase